MTETLIVMPLLIVFVLAVLQLGLIWRAKVTLEYAAFEAARAGSLNNAQPLPFVLRLGGNSVGSAVMEATTNVLTRGSVWQGMVNGMLPLYVSDPNLAGLATGWGRAHRDLIESACIEYLNPTQQAFVDWGFIENVGENRGLLQIPNDTLRYRKPLPYDYKVKAGTDAVSGQPGPPPPDAELRGDVSHRTLGGASVLHLRVHYGYRLSIPIVDRLLLAAFRLARGDAVNRLERSYLDTGRLPLSAESAVGMHTPAHWHPFYSFGPQENRSVRLQWDTSWNTDDERMIETPADTLTSVMGFLRTGPEALFDTMLAKGLDAAAAKVGSANAFCPAIWQDGFKDPLRAVPNAVQPGTAAAP